MGGSASNEGGDEMREKIEQALNEIRPALQADGGDVDLVEVDQGTVKVRLQGACHGCPMAEVTMKQGIETAIKNAVPEVEKVVAV